MYVQKVCWVHSISWHDGRKCDQWNVHDHLCGMQRIWPHPPGIKTDILWVPHRTPAFVEPQQICGNIIHLSNRLLCKIVTLKWKYLLPKRGRVCLHVLKSTLLFTEGSSLDRWGKSKVCFFDRQAINITHHSIQFASEQHFPGNKSCFNYQLDLAKIVFCAKSINLFLFDIHLEFPKMNPP